MEILLERLWFALVDTLAMLALGGAVLWLTKVWIRDPIEKKLDVLVSKHIDELLGG